MLAGRPLVKGLNQQPYVAQTGYHRVDSDTHLSFVIIIGKTYFKTRTVVFRIVLSETEKNLSGQSTPQKMKQKFLYGFFFKETKNKKQQKINNKR